MYLKKLSVAVACSAMMLTGCQDFELESTAIGAFKQAYEDYFVSQVGGISPDQSWDFSTAGGHRGQGEFTRAIPVDDEGWYYPDAKTLNWMKGELEESTDNSDLCKDFYLSWTPGMTFDIVPIYEGLADMQWDLYMKVTPANGVGNDLYNKKIWSKGKNVQLYTTPSTTPGPFQYEEDKAAIWFVTDKRQGGSDVYIWPWTPEQHDGEHFTGNDYYLGTRMKKVGNVGNYNIWKWNCTETTDIPTKVKFFDPNGVEIGVYDFVNHGYLYESESNIERPNYNFCIYFRTRKSNAFIHAWSSNGNITSWPGEQMTWVRDEEDSTHKIFRWTCNTLPTGVIFSNNGDNKTGDIILDPSQQYAYYDEDAGSVSYLPKASAFTAPDPESGWHDFADTDNAQYADGFRAQKINIPDLADNNWPLGSIVSFYLKITDNHGLTDCADKNEVMSSLNQQIVYLDVPEDYMPSDVDKSEGAITYIIGVEDSKITKSGSDKDYNDVVFLINGVMPKPVVIENNPSASTVPVEKRYMAEDLTNTGDMDFNDIVVDVKSVRWTYWRENTTTGEKEVHTGFNETLDIDGQTLTFTNGICDVQTATVQHLCGTIPIRFKVGNTELPWITDPTNLDQSRKQLRGEPVTDPDYGTGSNSTTGINPEVTLRVSGWDPKTNNVVVYAGWDPHTGKATKPATGSTEGIIDNENSNWCSEFPAQGTVPCIIATDVTDMWTGEFVDITEAPWWNLNFISGNIK